MSKTWSRGTESRLQRRLEHRDGNQLSSRALRKAERAAEDVLLEQRACFILNATSEEFISFLDTGSY